jgi:hypothetical protein
MQDSGAALTMTDNVLTFHPSRWIASACSVRSSFDAPFYSCLCFFL